MSRALVSALSHIKLNLLIAGQRMVIASAFTVP